MNIKRLFSPRQRRLIKKIYNDIFHHQPKIISDYLVETIDADNSFFGYYDIVPVNQDRILYLKLNKQIADIWIYDIVHRTKTRINKTFIWNWQQGCRLRWAKDGKSIYYNDLRNTKLVSVKYNLVSKDELVFDMPFYDVDRREVYGLSLDFCRLGKKRPGYGYVVGEYCDPSVDELLDNGVILVNLNTQEKKTVVRYRQLLDCYSLETVSEDIKKCYINHLSFSPSGVKFLFFWLMIQPNGIHRASLYVYDIEKEKLTLLENELSVSHYTWKDDNTLLVTAYDQERNCRYYEYNIREKTRNIICEKVLTEDGHPSYISENEIVTDTYPDKYGYERIKYVNIQNGVVQELLRVYHSYKVTGEQRCDLHPRLCDDGRCICFDANISGKRQFMLLKEWKNEE